MLVLDSTDAEIAKRTEQGKNLNTPSLPKPGECSLDWFNQEDFLIWSRRQKDAEFPLDYDV